LTQAAVDERPSVRNRKLAVLTGAGGALLFMGVVAAKMETRPISNEVMKQNVFLMKDEVTTDEVASVTVDESEETESVDMTENVFTEQACGGEREACTDSRCCTADWLKCYKKNAHYAACFAPNTCQPGQEMSEEPEKYRSAWECVDITRTSAEAESGDEASGNATEEAQEEDEETTAEPSTGPDEETTAEPSTGPAGLPGLPPVILPPVLPQPLTVQTVPPPVAPPPVVIVPPPVVPAPMPPVVVPPPWVPPPVAPLPEAPVALPPKGPVAPPPVVKAPM